MISARSYKKEWIESFRKMKEYSTVNPPLFEKVIYALSLLKMLVISGSDFIFKGGTSLLLMPVGSNRFSVDIDIITEMSKSALEQAIQKSIAGSVFNSFHEDKARLNAGGIPKAHYIFMFDANFNKEGQLLLDVLFEKNPYRSFSEVEIQCRWVETQTPLLLVKIPSVDSILGDKLTAFAPNTTGIPYWLNNPDIPDKRIEIIKQLYDVSNLINHCQDIEEVRFVFEAIAIQQISYRGLAITANNVIDDIFKTALLLARRERNFDERDKSCFAELQSGLKMFEGYLINTKFRIENAIVAATKAAYFTQKIKFTTGVPFELFRANSEVFGYNIINKEFNFLNRFKKTNREAYYYWYKCLELMSLLQ